MIFSLLLDSITILLSFFFLFLVGLTVFSLTIPTGAPITAPNDAAEMLPFVTDKTINDLSK